MTMHARNDGAERCAIGGQHEPASRKLVAHRLGDEHGLRFAVMADDDQRVTRGKAQTRPRAAAASAIVKSLRRGSCAPARPTHAPLLTIAHEPRNRSKPGLLGYLFPNRCGLERFALECRPAPDP